MMPTRSQYWPLPVHVAPDDDEVRVTWCEVEQALGVPETVSVAEPQMRVVPLFAQVPPLAMVMVPVPT
jgi:hypothetical protein